MSSHWDGKFKPGMYHFGVTGRASDDCMCFRTETKKSFRVKITCEDSPWRANSVSMWDFRTAYSVMLTTSGCSLWMFAVSSGMQSQVSWVLQFFLISGFCWNPATEAAGFRSRGVHLCGGGLFRSFSHPVFYWCLASLKQLLSPWKRFLRTHMSSPECLSGEFQGEILTNNPLNNPSPSLSHSSGLL